MKFKNLEKLKERVYSKINELIELGKIPVGNADEYIEQEAKKIKRGMPYINEFGIFNEIARDHGISFSEENLKPPTESEVEIKDLVSRINDHDNDIISIKGVVTNAFIRMPKKKNKKTGEVIDGEFWRIANIELTDETGSTMYSQFYYDDLEEVFSMIESGEIIGKVMALHNISVSASNYTGHETKVAVKRGGRVEFVDDNLDIDGSKIKISTISSVRDENAHYFLLKVLKKETKTTKTGKDFLKLFCGDQNGDVMEVTVWFEGATEIELEKGDTILVEGWIKSREYEGKIYKGINVNNEFSIDINPEGYDMNITAGETVEKSLMDVMVNDNISTTVLIKKFFGGRKPYYDACPVVVNRETRKKCNKGVNLQDDGSWKCNGGHVLSDEEANLAEKVVIASGLVTDGVSMQFKIFDRGEPADGDEENGKSVIEKITGTTKDNFIENYESLGTELFYERLNQDVAGRFYKIKAKVEIDTYHGSLSLNITDAEVVDIDAAIDATKESIKTTI